MKKLLLIEDETKLSKEIAETFSSGGLAVISAGDGETGLKRAEEERPDLIILDLVLPKKDGFTVLAELKARPTLCDIPVMVLSNLEGRNDIERARELGADAYLVKANYSLKDVFGEARRMLSLE